VSLVRSLARVLCHAFYLTHDNDDHSLPGEKYFEALCEFVLKSNRMKKKSRTNRSLLSCAQVDNVTFP
jgi:hypothetical protein